MIQGATKRTVMHKDPKTKKRKAHGWTLYLSVIATVLIAIAVVIDPGTLNVIALIFMLLNVGLHYKDIFRG